MTMIMIIVIMIIITMMTCDVTDGQLMTARIIKSIIAITVYIIFERTAADSRRTYTEHYNCRRNYNGLSNIQYNMRDYIRPGGTSL